MAVEPGTITTQSAEASAFSRPTMHTASSDMLTSKIAIASRTVSAQGKGRSNEAASVTDRAVPISERSLDDND
jgi:hypothetical protein